jgi:hypothetical protein
MFETKLTADRLEAGGSSNLILVLRLSVSLKEVV